MEAISTIAARRRAILIAILTILAGGIGAFSNSFKGRFIFDDLLALTQNATTARLWRLDRVLHPPVDMTVGGRPVLNLSFAIDRAIFGVRPGGYHLTNLLIHLAAALALFGIVRRTWKGADGVWIAGAAALLWVVHPLQTESVTYVVQRAESLMGLFYLLTLYCFVRGSGGSPLAVQKAAGRRFYWLSLLFCWLGMATKEAMVSAPVIVLLYDRTFIAGSFSAAWRRRRGYYLALFSSWLLLAVLIAGTHGRGGTVGIGFGVGVLPYWLTQFPAIVRYLWLSFWPNPLVFDYGTEWVTNYSELIPCVAVVALLIGITLHGLRRRTAAGLVGFFFFAILAPTSLVPGVRQTAAEHRMYLPLAAVILAAVIGAYRAWGRRTLLLWPVLAVPLARLSYDRNWFYAHPVAMWQDTVAKRPTNPFSRNNYGAALLAARLPANALVQLQESVRLKPDFMEGHGNLGNAFLSTGDLRNALREYRIARDLGPKYAAVHNNYGVALLTARQFDDAREEFEAALKIDPEFAEPMNNLGNVWLRTGHPAEAVDWYRKALRIDPHLPRTAELLEQAERLSAAQPSSAAR